MESICVFCGSSEGTRREYAEAARALGARLARDGRRLVYGAGSIGLMGLVADAALEGGGTVVGVIPEKLARAEVMHDGLTERHVVSSMHERKALMSLLSDAFIAMPGGFGTLEELFEVVTWAQLGIQAKPIGLLDVAGYYAPLLAMVDRGIEEGFIRPRYRELFVAAQDIDALLEALESFTSPPSVLRDMGLEDS